MKTIIAFVSFFGENNFCLIEKQQIIFENYIFFNKLFRATILKQKEIIKQLKYISAKNYLLYSYIYY